MRELIEKTLKVPLQVASGFQLVSIIALFTMIGIGFIETILRMLGRPIFTLSELGASALVIVTFAALGEAFSKGRHLRVEMFLDRVPHKGRQWVELLQGILALGFCIFFTVVLWQMTLATFKSGAQAFVSGYVIWPIHLVMVLGVAALAIALIGFIVEKVGLILRSSHKE